MEASANSLARVWYRTSSDFRHQGSFCDAVLHPGGFIDALCNADCSAKPGRLSSSRPRVWRHAMDKRCIASLILQKHAQSSHVGAEMQSSRGLHQRFCRTDLNLSPLLARRDWELFRLRRQCRLVRARCRNHSRPQPSPGSHQSSVSLCFFIYTGVTRSSKCPS